MKDVTRLVGRKPGSTSVVLAGVHGDEPCGVQAVSEVLESIKVERGIVYFLIGNPEALAAKTRKTEFDLNRSFRERSALPEKIRQTYEVRRAEFLKTYLGGASALLDVHSSSTRDSTPFVICENNGFEIAETLPADLVASGFDSVCPGGTDEYMNRIGRIGICIECGYHNDPNSVTLGVTAINSFLSTRGHISPIHTPKVAQRKIRVAFIYRTKSAPFRLSKAWADFEKVRAGEVIGFDGETPVITDRDAIILFADNCNLIGEEAFYLAYES